MKQIINFTEKQIFEKRNELTKKLKLMGKSIQKITIIVGGVAVAIIFPFAIVLANVVVLLLFLIAVEEHLRG